MSIDYYNQHADEFFANTVNVDMTELYQKFTKHLPNNAKVLDAGCGSGRDSKAFLDMGYDVDAFDASEEMVKLATKFTGIDVERKSFTDVSLTDRFDGIWCCASLLHVPINDLEKAFSHLILALRKDGIFYVSFKHSNDFREIQQGDRVFTCLNKQVLKSLIAVIGKIRVVEIWETRDLRPDRSQLWINAILKRIS